jgi:hypothetical protein
MPEDKEQVYLEPFFLLGYYFGMSYTDYKNFPVSYKVWLIKRINTEITKASEQQNDIPAKGAHNHTPDMRALTQKSRTNVPAKLQRFT